MKKKTFLTCACLIEALTALVIGVAGVNAGSLENRGETWNQWGDCYRANGPGTKFNNSRTAKISVYSTSVNNAMIARTNADRDASAKLKEDVKKMDPDKAFEIYDNALRQNTENCIKAEQDAYDALVVGIRNDYRTALAERANEYRNSRKTWRNHFDISAKSKPRPYSGHRYDSVSGGLIHPKVQSGQGWRLEWEVADPNVHNPDAHHLSGNFHKKEVTPVNDGQNIGIRFFFEVKGPDYNPGGSRRSCSGDPWCTFKLTEATCVNQARRDMGGVTDEQLVSCKVLLDQVGFKRQTIQK